jgi:hypothetical protein
MKVYYCPSFIFEECTTYNSERLINFNKGRIGSVLPVLMILISAIPMEREIFNNELARGLFFYFLAVLGFEFRALCL